MRESLLRVGLGPAEACTGSQRARLQFPLFGPALTFWVLLLTYVTNRFALAVTDVEELNR